MQQIWHINRITKHIHHPDQEKQLEYMSRRTGVGRAEWKSFAANVPVAKKLICKGFERYSWQNFGPNVGYLNSSRALLCTMIPSWMSCWMKQTRRTTCLLHPRKCMLCAEATQPEDVLKDWSGLKLQKPKFHGRLEGPHIHTRTASQDHELHRSHA